jgi:hypothetical protein
MPLVFGTLGLAVDLGWCYFLKERVQTAADAAASAAAVYALNNNDTCTTVTCGTEKNCSGVTSVTSSLTAGCVYATADGPPVLSAKMIENDSSHPPSGLTGVAPTIWIKATVTSTKATSFLGVLGFLNSNISASAIAGVNAVPATSCIYALDPTAPDALQIKGTASVSTSNCAIFVDSNNSTAFDKTGSGNINGTIDIVGNYSQVGSGTITPAPATGKSSVSDPLASLVAPTFSGCDYVSYNTSASATRVPGVYCGGITVTGSGTITMGSGIYIMNGGGMNVGGSANVTAPNVMIYNTATTGHTIGAISFTGSGTLTMSAPSSGTYEGILMFQDRTQSIAGAVNGTSTSAITGSLYFPDANLTYTGNTTAQFTALIADTITMVGNSSFKSDTYGVYTGISLARASIYQ